MSLRGLDEYRTGNWGEDYWGDHEDDADAFVCQQCRSGAHSWCKGGNPPRGCQCPGRYGRTAKEHGPFEGPVALVLDQPISHADFRRTDMVPPQIHPAPALPQAPGLQIRKAERKQAKLRLALAGTSGSGKTYSALLIAFGLGGKKIGMIDTERDSGHVYSHLGDYDIISLAPPYTVTRYLEAMNMFEVAGYDTIIIDSITHEWAGEGGLLRAKEQIDAKNNYANPFASWAKITPHHDRFIAAMLGSPCHIIATMRSKMVYVQEGGNIKKRGVEPIQRDQIEYEFTVVLDFVERGVASATKDRTELFNGWMEQITPRVGERLLNWLNSGAAGGADGTKATTGGPKSEPPQTHQQCNCNAIEHDGRHFRDCPAHDAEGGEDADGEGEALGADASQPSAPVGEPADKDQIQMISRLMNATVKRIKANGTGDYAKAMGVVNQFSSDGIPGLLSNQIELLAEALQKL